MESEKVVSTVSNTITVIYEGSDNEDDEDDDEEESGDRDGTGDRSIQHNKKEKLTRAQRRKKKLRNAQKHEDLKEKKQKQMTHDLHYVKGMMKQLAAEEERRKSNQKKKVDIVQSGPLGMSYDDAGAVLLSEELTSSLRTLRPRTCPIKSHVAAMVSSGDAVGKRSRKRRAFEKPHQAKRVKWVAKYKYSERANTPSG